VSHHALSVATGRWVAADSSGADTSKATPLDPQPKEVLAMADLGKGWMSGYMRSGRYAYQKVLVHTTNPAHLVPSAGTPSNGPPLRIAARYAAGR